MTLHVPLYTEVLEHSLRRIFGLFCYVTKLSIVPPLELIQKAANDKFISWKTRKMDRPSHLFVRTLRFYNCNFTKHKEKRRKI